MATRVLITGANGLLGRALMRAMAGEETLGTALGRARGGLRKVDLTDRAALEACFEDSRPEIVIHSAAVRRPDVCENDRDLTFQVNVRATGWVAELARACGAWVITLSTDYVFDGTSPPYAVDAEPNPVNIYGRSKLDGEEALRGRMPHGAVLRVPILYGPVERLDESAVTIIAEQVIRGIPGKIDDWAIRYPTHVDDVAAACRRLAEAWRDGAVDARRGGVFHFSGREPMTKADMARVIADVLGADASHLEPDANPPAGAPRPKNCQLDCSRLDALLSPRRTGFCEGIAAVLAEQKARLPHGKSRRV